jgi:cation transport ATPase
MPRLRFEPPAPDPNYQLIDREDLEEELKDIPQEVRDEIFKDMEFMEYELMRLFRQRDYEAKKQQNRYRRIQILYLLLAALATMIGSVQALTFSTAPETMPLFSFLSTVVALMVTFLATISGRESPLPLWLTNRRRAEQLRREYFRYLTRMSPYDDVEAGYPRRMLLSKRAADINRGVYPQEVDPRTGTGNG